MQSSYTVGFTIQSPFHYFLYESIINELVSRDINCHLLINDSIKYDKEWEEMYNSLVKFIEMLERKDIEAFLVSTVEIFGFQYDCIVSPYYIDEVRKLGKKNIRLMYSLAKENWTYSWWNIFFDKILCYGEYDFKKLNIYDNCTIVGNPKFDNWFNDISALEINKIIEKYDLKLNKNIETIIYAPTFGELSSIDEWIEEVSQLKDDYNIIIKLHHGTAHLKSEKQRRDIIRKHFINVLDDSANLLDLLKISEYVITDYSGIIFDSILAKKNILLLNNGNASILSDESSAEVKVRKEIVNVEKGTSIKYILQNKEMLKIQLNKMEALKNTYFSMLDGNAGKRAAKEIIKELNERENKENKLLQSLKQKLFIDSIN
ncbi:CDP-glycerol glycerophosphotransferase family protein [Bacillus sp. IITD106]|nr:CDP-glycerol glycerophosphotransferase family protein [Bacillus sp. IITD106]